MGYFLPKILRHGAYFGQKILRRGSHFTKIFETNVKSGISVVEKPLEMSPDLQKFWEKKPVKSAVFEGEKWVGVSELGPHTPSNNNFSTCNQHG